MSSTAIAPRLDDRTRKRLAAIAKRRGATRSGVLREAIDSWLRKEEGEFAIAPFELVKDLVGSVHGGDPDRSSDVGRKTAAKLRLRRGARRR